MRTLALHRNVPHSETVCAHAIMERAVIVLAINGVHIASHTAESAAERKATRCVCVQQNKARNIRRTHTDAHAMHPTQPMPATATVNNHVKIYYQL